MDQIFRIDHFQVGKAAQNILAFAPANGLFGRWRRATSPRRDRRPWRRSGDSARRLLRAPVPYRDMVVTPPLQILAFTAVEPPPPWSPRHRAEQGLP